MVARLSNEGIYKSGVASVTAQKADETTPAAVKEEGEVKKPSYLRIKAESWVSRFKMYKKLQKRTREWLPLKRGKAAEVMANGTKKRPK